MLSPLLLFELKKKNYSIINYYLRFMANYTIVIISLYLQLHARDTFRYAKMYVSSTRDKPLDSSANASELDRILLHFGLYWHVFLAWFFCFFLFVGTRNHFAGCYKRIQVWIVAAPSAFHIANHYSAMACHGWLWLAMSVAADEGVRNVVGGAWYEYIYSYY